MKLNFTNYFSVCRGDKKLVKYRYFISLIFSDQTRSVQFSAKRSHFRVRISLIATLITSINSKSTICSKFGKKVNKKFEMEELKASINIS